MAKGKGMGKWVFIIIFVIILTFTSMILAGIISLLSTGGTTVDLTGNVAFIEIKGVILTEGGNDFFDRSANTGSSHVVSILEEIKDDPSIQAVVFEINSPGGSGVAADEIATAIKELNKTTVSYIREMGTSAAYWIASSTDHVIANRVSMVGSIGVIASYLDFSEFIEEYNVSYQRFVAGDYKDFGVPFREPSRAEKELFQGQLDMLHDVFIHEVANNRDLPVEDVREIAHGMFFLGMQGKELGLVDELGGKSKAIAYLENELNITVDFKTYHKQTSFFDLFSYKTNSFGYDIGRGLGHSLTEENNGAIQLR